MPEKNLSPEQKKKIDEIKAEWMEEVKKIPETHQDRGKPVLDGGGGPYRKLELKYMKQIKEIVEASE